MSGNDPGPKGVARRALADGMNMEGLPGHTDPDLLERSFHDYRVDVPSEIAALMAVVRTGATDFLADHFARDFDARYRDYWRDDTGTSGLLEYFTVTLANSRPRATYLWTDPDDCAILKGMGPQHGTFDSLSRWLHSEVVGNL